MFHIEIDAEKNEHVLVSPGGGRIPVRADVWERLRDPDEVFGEWKKLMQKWAIHAEKAPVLKGECPTDQEYRELRTLIRMHGRLA